MGRLVPSLGKTLKGYFPTFREPILRGAFKNNFSKLLGILMFTKIHSEYQFIGDSFCDDLRINSKYYYDYVSLSTYDTSSCGTFSFVIFFFETFFFSRL